MPAEELLFDQDGDIAIITLNRPERGNALTNAVFERLTEHLDRIEDDTSLRAVLLTGAGPSFCTGFDISGDQPRTSRHDFQHHADLVTGAFWRIWNSRLPFVVAARGRCTAGGLYFAAVCDLMLVSEDAQLGMPELQIGMRPPLFNIFPWMMTYRAAKEFLLTGGLVDGRRAVDLGLANRAVPDDRLMDEATALARSLARMPDDVVAVMKRSVNRRWELAGLRTGIEDDVEAFVEDKLHMGPYQAEYRRLSREIGPRAARERLDRDPPRSG
jgi:enoyl-CoA hydratase